MDADETNAGVRALAQQGGGAHGAFTWGVLDRLREEGVRFDRVSGVSSGALLDPAALVLPTAPRLTVAATAVETGAAAPFGNAEITVDVLPASTCRPFVFPAGEIDGPAYWDGGYAGNPPLAPLLAPHPPDDLVLIAAQPARRPGVPRTAAEILNRRNEIACHNVLQAELAALPAGLRPRSFTADAEPRDLPISSKFNADPDFLASLFAAGRAASATLTLTAPPRPGLPSPDALAAVTG